MMVVIGICLVALAIIGGISGAARHSDNTVLILLALACFGLAALV